VPPDLANDGPDADAVLQQHERRDAIQTAIRALPLTLSQPAMLHLEGFTAREIAEILGITENNAAVRLTRARHALRKTLSTG
jgi:RNA polymerase sigma-70 factor, ECF subfamily